MKLKKIIALVTLLGLEVVATTITGVGYGLIESEAKKEALADLSTKISVEVKSDFTSVTKSMGDSYSKSSEKLVELSSKLPLIGVVFTQIDGDKLVQSKAELSSESVLNLYLNEIHTLHKNINHSQQKLKETKNDDIRYTLLNQLLSDMESFEKYKIVATILGGQNLPTIELTKSEINIQLQKLLEQVSSINIAAKLLSSNISQSNIYISSLNTSNSNEVTPFAKILKNEISKYINTVKFSKDADYFLKGEYEILQNSIFVTYNLLDINNKILKTNTVLLHPTAYSHMQYKPTTKTFDSAINSEFVKSGKLDVQIGFKGYNRANGIDLNAGDTVDIVVKTNKPMCYFLVGHTLKSDSKFSYLLPIGSDYNPFINRITGEDVNRYITIADGVPVEAPFGSENLQIFSSTFDEKGQCSLVVPNCVENEDGYCIVDGAPEQVVTKTRALNLKKKKVEVEKAEDSVSWTSFEK